MSHERDYEAQLVAEDRALWERALRRLAAGDAAAAEEDLRALLARQPGFVPALNKLGVCRVRRGDREDARRWFERALAADGRFVPALSNLATVALEEGDLDRAIALYRQALAIDPAYSVARENLAAAYRRRGDLEAAVRELRRAHRDEVRALLGRWPDRVPVGPDGAPLPAARAGCLPVLLAVLGLCAVLAVWG